MVTIPTVHCDNCGATIEVGSQKVQLIVFTDQEIADPMIDLCWDCSAGIRADKALSKALTVAQERIAESV